MTAVVLSVNKVASFPDGGGHFWVYLQYALGLRQLGCEVYWLEQLRPVRDPDRRAYVIATFQDRMKQFGFEGRTLLYARCCTTSSKASRASSPVRAARRRRCCGGQMSC